eukprot:TRINITY_DN144_c4_g1_i1.p1 TRINITY_DN144_c4_g1~~TRINITY_DN144_c4_g1_i1.p1  ORF type:complete len:184 (+),score=25.48 TRINITY_DN144_c4_g1_i1:269-820(+)
MWLLVLICCWVQATAWSASMTKSSLHCHVGESTTAGNAFKCDIQLRDESGTLVGDVGDLCKFGANLTDATTDSDTQCSLSPFSGTDTTGEFSLSVTPRVAGSFHGSILYDSQVLGDISVLVLPASEDLSKTTASCAVLNSLTECTTTHRDRFDNPTRTCFQRWGDSDSDSSSGCTIIQYTTTS